MPIYEFVCAECDHEFESLQRLSDPLPTDCPECGKGPVTKKISAAGFRLKGGGWYETDFKNGSKGSAPAKAAGDGAASGAGGGGATSGGSAAGGAAGSSSSGSSGKDAAATSTASPSKPSKPSGGSSE